MSGYTPCACRDCMDTTVSSDTSTSKPELCSACQEAGCEAWRTTAVPMGTWYGPSFECQRADAYTEV